MSFLVVAHLAGTGLQCCSHRTSNTLRVVTSVLSVFVRFRFVSLLMKFWTTFTRMPTCHLITSL